MSVPRMPISITTSDIAEIAGVGRPAVGNWRKRHPDFPLPGANDRFDLDEVERWLIEKGKISGPVSRSFVLWRLGDALGKLAPPRDVLRFIIAMLVYLEVCERSSARGMAASQRLPAHVGWSQVREADDDELAGTLIEAARTIESHLPAVAGLMVPGLEFAQEIDSWFLRAFIDFAHTAEDPRFDLFEDAVTRLQEVDRFRGEFSTPPDLTHLMVRLGAQRAGTVLDPATGEGGLLLMAALSDDRDTSQPMRLCGWELNSDIANIARARFFLYDLPVELHAGDVFRTHASKMPKADLVLLDPPLGMAQWGDADVYLDERWSFGVPPPNNADFAWIQLAIEVLAPHGRAVVASPQGSTFRTGREGAIRSALLDAGCVTAIVQLPPRLRTNTSIPLVLWVLRAPQAPRHAVLMVDAGQLGEAGRSVHSLNEEDIERIVRAVHEFEEQPDQPPQDPKIAWAVPIAQLVEDGALLQPARYRPAVTVDVASLRQRRDELHNSLAVDVADAQRALGAVLDRLGSDR